MNSSNYNRAQAMIMDDKYNLSRTEFFKELRLLVSKYMECDAITVDTYSDVNLNIVVTISAKKLYKQLSPVE